MPDISGRLNLDGEALGGYRLVRRLAAGGMAEVYEGRQRSLGDRPVALKVVRADDAALASVPRSERVNVKEHFVEEGRLLARFAHPNILPVHDAGIDRGYLYLVMQYVPEGSLADAIRGRSPHPLRLPASLLVAVDIVSQLADALQYTHEHGVVHRDVKPSNVLVRTEPHGRQHVFLADFGIARSVESTAEGGKIVGTVAYMAPEQFSGESVPASDQYALAALAYQLLTGRTPFMGTAAEQTYGHLYGTPQPARALNRAVPTAVSAVIQRALSKRPADRYPSAEAFAQALRTAAAAVTSHSGDTTEPNLAGGLLPASASTRTAATVKHPDRVPTAKDLDRQPTIVLLDRARGQPVALGSQSQAPITGTTQPLTPAGSPPPAAPPPRASRGRKRILPAALAVAVLLLALTAAIASRGLGTSRGAPPLGSRPTATSTSAVPTSSSGSPAPAATSAPGTAPPATAAAGASGSPPATTPTPVPPPTTVESPKSGDAAKVTSLTVPVAVTPGARFTAILVLTNTGTTTWTDASDYRLICDALRYPVQNCPRRLNVSLAGTTIGPHQTARFTLTLVAPPAPGTYQAWINMAHDNALFPSPDIAIRVVVQPPTPTPAASPSPSASASPTPTPSPSPLPSPSSSPTPMTPATTGSVTAKEASLAASVMATSVLPFLARRVH